MLYPNRLQAALLFDSEIDHLDAIVRDFIRIETMRSGAKFFAGEDNSSRLSRVFDPADELVASLEYRDMPPAARAFGRSLSSPYTGIVTPDIRDRIDRCRSHILIEVSHGIIAEAEETRNIAALVEATGQPPSGAGQPQFERRLAVLALLGRIATDYALPLAVHWEQSDQLMSGGVFDRLAAGERVPGPLHIHPFLFGPPPAPGDDALIGFRTFGARHWLGREVIVQPNVLPWAANLDTVFAFLRAATMPDGYVIPEGDTFGHEDSSVSYGVIHHDVGADIGYCEAEPADMPLYELLPLKHVAQGSVAPAHVPDGKVFDDRAFPAGAISADRMAAVAQEPGGRNMLALSIVAQTTGGAGTPSSDTAPPLPPARITPPSGMTGLGGRGLRPRVFGRKGL